MITVHHLGVSQSDRIVWLMEELGLPYRLKWHRRTEDGSAPADYLALHPAATAPVIVRSRTAAIILRAPSASTAPTPIDPSAPAFDTAAAMAGVDTPAIGA